MNDTFFQALEVRRTQAIVGRDLDAIKRLHAPEYQLITPVGRIFTLERYLSVIAAEPFYAAWEHGHMKVAASPSMAAVRYEATLTFPSGKVVRCWHTDIYIQRQESWLALWSQATQLPSTTPGP